MAPRKPTPDAADVRHVLQALTARWHPAQLPGHVTAAAVRLDAAQAEDTGAGVLPDRWRRLADRHQAALDAEAAAADADGIAAGENPGSDQ